MEEMTFGVSNPILNQLTRMFLGMIRLTQLNKVVGPIIEGIAVYVMNRLSLNRNIIGVGYVPNMAGTRDGTSAFMSLKRHIGPQIPRFISTNPTAPKLGRRIPALITRASRAFISTSPGAIGGELVFSVNAGLLSQANWANKSRFHSDDSITWITPCLSRSDSN